MSHGLEYLHNHSALERELKLPKHMVLIDAKFVNMFAGSKSIPFEYCQIRYFKVPTLEFVKQGGIFKNLSS